MKGLILGLITLLTALPVFSQFQRQIRKLDNSKISQELLTSELGSIVENSGITGLSVVIINNHKVAYQHTFGYRNRETGAPLTRSTVMYAASFTKPVTAYLFLRLVDKGVFNLDKPLAGYLKEPVTKYERFAANDSILNKITARMILNHTSGLPVSRSGDRTDGKFSYSNEAMNLLGTVIEEYAGKRLDVLAKELVFDPLRMTRTNMVWVNKFENDFATGHSGTGAVVGFPKRSAAGAAASLITTASDYALFVNAMMQRKGLSKRLFNQMFDPQVRITNKRLYGPASDSLSNRNDDIKLSWGLGIGLFQTSFGRAFFHSGHVEGWQHYFVAYPDKSIAIILMSNSSNFERSARNILKLCIADELSPVEWLGYSDR